MKAPTATYRLQFREGMTFDRAAALVPYMRRLGISHLYGSPIFQAAQGSTHGYDVVDHNKLDADLGGREGFDRLIDALKQNGLGLILDIVPNHMAASPENAWWRSVLEWGEASPYAGHFDIDWSERLTLPVLGQPLGDAIAADEVTLALDIENGSLAIRAAGMLLPIAPSTYLLAMEDVGLPVAHRILHLARQALPGNASAFSSALRDLFTKPEGAGLGEALAERSRQPGVVEAVHSGQPWRLIHWKEGRRHLSYRRFFEVTGLVGVRVEDEQVFDDVHATTLELVRENAVQGLRIDHVDGLADPHGYLVRLRDRVGPELPIYVEKILGADELLPPSWPVEGTTGYEFISSLADLLVDASGLSALRAAYGKHVGREPDPLGEVHQAKLQIVEHNFESELSALVGMAVAKGMDPHEAKTAISELIAAMPVYRTYGEAAGMPRADLGVLRKAVNVATRRERASAAGLRRVANLLRTDAGKKDAEAHVLFRTRFQQLSGPVMAKSVEDTFFYRHHPLIALNEVGSEPDADVGDADAFHRAMQLRRKRQPLGLSATATHDTKRGEDARARLYALADDPDRWSEAVSRWSATAPATEAVDPATVWMIYQALAGVWPGTPIAADKAALANLRDRFLPFLQKALREAKRHTDWLEPDEAYESAVEAFASGLFGNNAFLEDFQRTLQPYIGAGRVNALSQTLAKLFAPGVPDIYQGSEGEDLSLVDPDNRRAPDFDALATALEREDSSGGRLSKQQLIAAGLRLRQAHPDLFRRGAYLPLAATGGSADHLFGFARRLGRTWLVAIGIRRPLRLLGDDSTRQNDDIAEASFVLPTGEKLKGQEMLSGTQLSLPGRIDMRGLLSLDRPVAAILAEAEPDRRRSNKT